MDVYPQGLTETRVADGRRCSAETLLRRPRALRDAVTLALIHKHLYEYMRETCRRLDELAVT